MTTITQAVDTQIVTYAASILFLATTTGIAYVGQHLKAWIQSHTKANVSTVGCNLIDSLSKVADGVAHDFNDRILRDAQSNGVLTPELLSKVKVDAVQSVLDQSGSLVSIGTKLGHDVQGLAFSMVAQSFNKLGIVPATPETTPAPSVSPAANTIGAAQA